MENTSEIVAGLQELQNQVKYFHWQTKSYAQHQALAKVFDSITELIDTFVETLMGKYGRPSTKGQKFEMFDLEDVNIEEWTGGVCDLLISFSDVLDDVQDTDLLNLRDEMLQNFNQLKYLLTLKENMNKKKVIKLSENDLYRIVKRVINEQASDSNRKKSIQCFLSKKGLYKGEIDGLMGEKTPAPDGEHQVVLKDTSGNENKIRIQTVDGKIVQRENVEQMAEVDMAEFPWDECMLKMAEEGYSEETAAKICGSIKAKNMTKAKMSTDLYFEQVAQVEKLKDGIAQLLSLVETINGKFKTELSELKSEFNTFKNSPERKPVDKKVDYKEKFEDFRVSILKDLRK